MEAEYDSIAEEYDATRDSATAQELDALRTALAGCKSIIDVGVGTGRFAKPLSDLGFDVTGVDVSRRMLLKAREKGLDRLFLADAYSLPFADKKFDAAIIVHVLHVVVDWITVVREIGRVTRGPVMSILRVQGSEQTVRQPSSATPPASRVRTQHRMWQNELELKARVPPVKLERIRDEIISIPVTDAIRRLQAKRSAGAQMVPPEIQQQMMERILSMAAGQSVQRSIVEDLAVWNASDLQTLTP